jgi:hypothetical protein
MIFYPISRLSQGGLPHCHASRGLYPFPHNTREFVEKKVLTKEDNRSRELPFFCSLTDTYLAI